MHGQERDTARSSEKATEGSKAKKWWIVGGVVAFGLLVAFTAPFWLLTILRLSDEAAIAAHWPKREIEPQNCRPTSWGVEPGVQQTLWAACHTSRGTTWLLIGTPGVALQGVHIDESGEAAALRSISLPRGWGPGAPVAGPADEPVIYAEVEADTGRVGRLFGGERSEVPSDACSRALGPSCPEYAALGIDETRGVLVAVWRAEMQLPPLNKPFKSRPPPRAPLVGATLRLADDAPASEVHIGTPAIYGPRHHYPLHWAVDPTLALDGRGCWWAGFGDSLFVSRDAGGTWQPEHEFEYGVIKDVCPCNDGSVWVAFAGKYTEHNGIWLSRRASDGKWTKPAFVRLAGDVRMSGTCVAVQPLEDGKLLIVYQSPANRPMKQCEVLVSDLVD